MERIRQNTSDARGDSLRITYGFTGTHTQTLFPQRIQALKIEQPLLWKPFGWYRVVVNIAGVAVNTEGSSDDLFTRNTALPVGTAREMQRLLHLLLPNVSPHSLETVQAVMESSRYNPADSRELGVVTAPRRTRWLNPLTFRRDGFARVNTEQAGVDDQQNRELQTPGHAPHPGSSLAAWRLPAAVPLGSPRAAGARGAVVAGSAQSHPQNRMHKFRQRSGTG